MDGQLDRQLSTTPANGSDTDHFTPGRAHLVGIGGSGLSALAEVLLDAGWEISGSDCSPERAEHLIDAGAIVHPGHCRENLPKDADLVVHSDAVPADNPELIRAARLGIPVRTYFEMLGRMMRGRHGLAVAGTHGKSTTTAMAAAVLRQSGLEPTVVCGAQPIDTCSANSANSEVMLVEACEYRANFLHLRPQHAVILGVEPDHFDFYGSTDQLEDAFGRFAGGVASEGLLLCNNDCPTTRRIADQCDCRVETFAAGGQADWTARELHERRGHYRFRLFHGERPLCEVSLEVPGKHNVLNALAAAALAWHNSAPPRAIVRGLERFKGLKRRLEPIGSWRGVSLVDDYAHHPTEVAATLSTVREMYPGRRFWCVFQPHQVSRTACLLDELAESLHNVDRLMVADIFRARESAPQPGEVTAADLARLAESGGVQVFHTHEKRGIVRLLQNRLAPGDVLLTMGAGDIGAICESLTAEQAG